MIRKIIFQTSEALRKIGLNFNNNKNQAILDMQKKMNQLGGIDFKIEVYPDGTWTVESTNIDGIITGGKSTKKMNYLIKDAIFTYFGIPSYLCNDKLIKGSNEPVIVSQRVWATK